ncbi:polysaccharide biosynthesis tyrosine autokinase [uncultured Photobacterium sp.]|uniref:GumC family protein n=1 Tax=uncultured Photobacterium sp. TaxID=173973 RepID=UPI002616D5E5|nr:polysaccharide biosynthesis tyrosine autokinase [uncultured Photobacterium sp.]
MSSLFVEEGSKLESTIDFSRLFKSTKKNWWKILAFVVIVTGISIPFILKLTPKYEAYATVLLKAQLANPTTFDKVVDFDSTRREYYETQYQLLKSRRVISRVVDNLKLYENREFIGNKNDKLDTLAKQKERSIQYVLKHMTVSPIRKTQLVEIGFESTMAKDAAAVANDIVKVFVNYSIEDNRDANLNVSSLLKTEVSDLNHQLKAKEAKLNAFLKTEDLITFRGVDGFQTEQLSLLMDNLATATAQRVNLEALYNVVTTYKKQGFNALAAIPDVSRHPQMENLRQMIIEQKSQLADLKHRYGPKYEKVIQAQSQLKILQRQATSLINEIAEGIKEQYQSAIIKQNQLQTAVDKRTNAFQLLGEKKTTYNNLMDDISQTRTLYNQLLQRQNETQVSGQFAEPTAKAIDSAIAPLKPTKPNKKLLIIVIAIMSLLISVLFVIVMAALNNRVMSINEIKRRLGLEVIGEIKLYPQSITPQLVVDNSVEFSTLDEASLGIRSQLLLLNTDAKILAVTSATAGEGKSLVSTLVAKAIAIDSKVLLIDMNLRHRSITHSFGYANNGGLTDILYNNVLVQDVIVNHHGIDILTVGSDTTCSPLLVLTHNKLSLLCTELRHEYDYIIIDTPAVTDAKDTVLISQLTDAILFVVASNCNSTNVSVSAINQLKQYKATVLGCVLNKVSESDLESNENIAVTSPKDVLL